jgi:hypothetical protein
MTKQRAITIPARSTKTVSLVEGRTSGPAMGRHNGKHKVWKQPIHVFPSRAAHAIACYEIGERRLLRRNTPSPNIAAVKSRTPTSFVVGTEDGLLPAPREISKT